MTREFKLFFLIAWAGFKRKWRLYALIFVLLVTSYALLTKLNPNLFRSNTLSEGIIGTYDESDLPDVATKLISEALVEMDDQDRPIPKLAAWEVNNDATQFSFTLKPDIKWSDGTKITSQDLDFNIPDVDVTYPDSETIQFKLKDSFSAFPSILTKPVFKKGHGLLGTGPYQVKRIEKSVVFITKITLEPKDQNLPKVILRFYPNEKIAETAFSLGEIQSLLGITNVNDFKDYPKARSEQKVSYAKVVAILYNEKDPVLSNRSLRQALSYAAPSIKDETAAKTSIPPNSWAFTGEVNRYLGNFDSAKQALARAKSGVKEEDLQKPIELTVTPTLLSLGQEVAGAWQSLGLKVIIRVEPGIPQNFQALLITQTIPADPDQYSLWHSTQTKTNLTRYSSARVDKDLEDGRKVTGEEERKNKYFDFQKALLEDSPATFLYFPKYNIVYLQKAGDKIKLVLPMQLASP